MNTSRRTFLGFAAAGVTAMAMGTGISSAWAMEGVVLWFNDRKGYGFIEIEKDNTIFFHQKDVKGGRLAKGYRVT